MSGAPLRDIMVNPTVGEVIEFLKKFHPDTAFRIKDADTGWLFNIIHTHYSMEFEGVDFPAGIMRIRGKYEDMR